MGGQRTQDRIWRSATSDTALEAGEMSPTQRTMERLRSEGWTTDKVEQRLPIPGRFVTRDMGGFADGIAWKGGAGILAWQATSGSNVAAHITKVINSDKLREWIL